MTSLSIKSLVDSLKAAQTAYYETETPLMSDSEYDRLVELLREQTPNHEFFSTPGPVPQKGREKLPVCMPSLRKIKPQSWSSWKYSTNTPCVISEKLDGISALWCSGIGPKGSLYLRGDGSTGQNISMFVPHIQGLVSKMGHWIIRGELITPASSINGTLARNWVNGVLHKDSPSSAELSQITFVAYQVIQPSGLTRSQQFAWLVNQGFHTVWNTSVQGLTSDLLSSTFKARRKINKYECDGIVIGVDAIPEKILASEPSDCVAYKEVSEDQIAKTTVLEVEWSPSKNGIWIPRLRLEPVLINTATIQYTTAFNAKFVEESKLGPGAVITIRRSGDVIPTIDSVLVTAKVVQMPPEGTWKWDTEHGVHAVCVDASSNIDVLSKLLVASCVAFGVEGFKEASANVLVKNGIISVTDCIKAGVKKCQEHLGTVNGEKFYKNLLKGIQESEDFYWIVAAPLWPRGFGASKLKAIYDKEPDVNKWCKISDGIKGIGSESLQKVVKCVGAYTTWRQDIINALPFEYKKKESVPVLVAPIIKKGEVCFSGFRDSDAERLLTGAGFIVKDTLTKDTKALFVASTDKVSVKSTNARKHGIPVLLKNEISVFLAAQSSS